MRVEALFSSVGLDLHGEPPPRCWSNMFMAKPTERLPGAADLTAVCNAFAKAQQEFRASERLRCDRFVNPTTDLRLTRLSLLYLTSFPGSKKTNFCRALAETIDQLRAGNANTEHDLLEAASATRRNFRSSGTGEDLPGAASPVSSKLYEVSLFDKTTVAWAKQLVLLGVNFNSERWSLSPMGSDGILAGSSLGLMLPLHLRLLFFARADFSDAPAAEQV